MIATAASKSSPISKVDGASEGETKDGEKTTIEQQQQKRISELEQQIVVLVEEKKKATSELEAKIQTLTTENNQLKNERDNAVFFRSLSNRNLQQTRQRFSKVEAELKDRHAVEIQKREAQKKEAVSKNKSAFSKLNLYIQSQVKNEIATWVLSEVGKLNLAMKQVVNKNRGYFTNEFGDKKDCK